MKIVTKKYFVASSGKEIPLETLVRVAWSLDGPYIEYSDVNSNIFMERLPKNDGLLFNHLLGILKYNSNLLNRK